VAVPVAGVRGSGEPGEAFAATGDSGCRGEGAVAVPVAGVRGSGEPGEAFAATGDSGCREKGRSTCRVRNRFTVLSGPATRPLIGGGSVLLLIRRSFLNSKQRCWPVFIKSQTKLPNGIKNRSGEARPRPKPHLGVGGNIG
jgi:hypothetical protein